MRLNTYDIGTLLDVHHGFAGMFSKNSAITHKDAGQGVFVMRRIGAGGVVGYY